MRDSSLKPLLQPVAKASVKASVNDCVPVIHQEALCDDDMSSLDPKDPNRPRFTLQELRDVLHERNELKAKVFMLQEEIAYYKRSTILILNFKPVRHISLKRVLRNCIHAFHKYMEYVM